MEQPDVSLISLHPMPAATQMYNYLLGLNHYVQKDKELDRYNILFFYINYEFPKSPTQTLPYKKKRNREKGKGGQNTICNESIILFVV